MAELGVSVRLLRYECGQETQGYNGGNKMRIMIVLVLTILLTQPICASQNAFDNGLDAFNKKDYETAFNIFKNLAEQGHTKAQVHLGIMYDYGVGVTEDYKQAVAWYMKAAKKNDIEAQLNLAAMYLLARGVKQDFKQAFMWRRKAAEQGSSLAEYYLGLMYVKGQGVRQNYQIAKEWYGKSCDGGNQLGCKGYRELNEKGIN